QKLWRASKTLTESGLYIDDNSMNTAMDILSKCRRRKRESGLDLVMIDYLQLMESEQKLSSRTLEVGEITRKLKIAAKELNVPIILLSQLSRQVEQRDDHHPVLSDLRDSGSIEQDADIVMFLYNPDKYNDTVKNADEHGLVELELAKHRNGEVGMVKLKWVGSWLRFFDFDSTEAPVENYTAKQDNQLSELQPNDELDTVFGDEAEAPLDSYVNLEAPPEE
ncbi:MAG: DnaB-like helicase C-terminal domain-containing protein, partial [Clostridia bacterium]|nr:DnaB-like helicase C-terminal domain-containing protein [Clostridia bacterium]